MITRCASCGRAAMTVTEKLTRLGRGACGQCGSPLRVWGNLALLFLLVALAAQIVVEACPLTPNRDLDAVVATAAAGLTTALYVAGAPFRRE